jgi:hypothetical protein
MIITRVVLTVVMLSMIMRRIAIVLIFVVLFSACLSFYQEGQTERAMSSFGVRCTTFFRNITIKKILAPVIAAHAS